MSPLPIAHVVDDRRALELEWPDGERRRYHSVWLRDNGRDKLSRDPDSGQKKFSIKDLDLDMEITGTHIADDRLELKFSDGTETWLDTGWLQAMECDQSSPVGLFSKHISLWDGSLDPTSVTADFGKIRESTSDLVQWLSWVRDLGFARLTGVPQQSGALFDVIALFGFVRETNYGRMFEVRSTAKPVNLAYTREGLDPHTDNPYRDPVPTLQILHCIENDCDGGDSVVVDGFKCVEVLRRESAKNFNLLSHYDVNFEYQGDGLSHLKASRPHIELSPRGELLVLRVNNRSISALTDVPYEKIPNFYRAQSHFAEITLRAALTVQFRLEPGELFIVDNTRVLHGRTTYSETGTRWFQGAYADKDSLLSTIRLHSEHGKFESYSRHA